MSRNWVLGVCNVEGASETWTLDNTRKHSEARRLTGCTKWALSRSSPTNPARRCKKYSTIPGPSPPMSLSQSQSLEISGVFDSALASLDFNFLLLFRLLLFLLKVFLLSKWLISKSGDTVSEYHWMSLITVNISISLCSQCELVASLMDLMAWPLPNHLTQTRPAAANATQCTIVVECSRVYWGFICFILLISYIYIYYAYIYYVYIYIMHVYIYIMHVYIYIYYACIYIYYARIYICIYIHIMYIVYIYILCRYIMYIYILCIYIMYIYILCVHINIMCTYKYYVYI